MNVGKIDSQIAVRFCIHLGKDSTAQRATASHAYD